MRIAVVIIHRQYAVQGHIAKRPYRKFETYIFRKGITHCAALVPISTFICLRAIYIIPRSICLFCCRKYVDQSWEYINRSQTHECGNWD